MLLPALLLLALHANSLSASRIEVTGGRLVHELEIQTLSVVEVLPELDRNQDLALDPDERASGEDAIVDYVRRHYVIRDGGPEGARIRGRLVLLRESSPDANLTFASQRLLLRFEHEQEQPLTGLNVEVSLFETTSPGHRDFCLLAWAQHPDLPWTFSVEAPVLAFEPVSGRLAKVGLDHVRRGALGALSFELLGLAAVLALACGSVRAARIAGLSAAVACGGAVLVACALADVLPERLLELAAALVVPYAAAETAFGRTPRPMALEGGLFGIVIGSAEGVRLAEGLSQEPFAPVAMGAYALALSGTAWLLVAVIASAVRVRSGDGLAPRWLARSGSALLAAAGLWRFARSAWFPGRNRP